jgi:uncharacterized protein YllA (UPF0747 family)
MTKKIKFEDLPGFSKLFVKQVNQITSPTNLFISQNNNDSAESKISLLSDFSISNNLITIIANTARKLKSSEQQRENIRLLQSNNSFVCTATIKPAFTGGPSNIMLKLLSVFLQSENLKKRFKKFNFIPILWIDDDVHDNLESSQCYVFSHSGHILNFSCSKDASKTDRTAIHKKIFHNEINSIIKQITDILPDSQRKPRVSELLKNAYQTDYSWSFASTKMLNSLFKYLGVLFIFSSDVRKSGLFNNLIAKELSERGKTFELIKTTQTKLKKFDIDIPDKSYSYNLNIHIQNQVEKCTKKESMKFTDYSPNIMLRSVFEDSLLPVVSRICSPSEFIYSLLLDDIYNHFETIKPAHLPRFSATFIDAQTKSFIQETGTDLKEVISGYKRLQKMMENNENIRKAVNWLYPNENLQERLISMVNIFSASGKQFAIRTVRKLSNTEPAKHFIINI